MANDGEPTLFTWRGVDSYQVDYPNHVIHPKTIPDIFRTGPHCPYCMSEVERTQSCGYYEFEDTASCKTCGFSRFSWGYFDELEISDTAEYNARIAKLKTLSINDAELTFEELGSHLKRRYDDIYHLEPYRFEQLIGDVFRKLGYHVVVSTRSKDGGIDLYLLKRDDSTEIIVQCKRYKKTHKVDVTAVRELAGVMLIDDHEHALLVTTSGFTRDAQHLASRWAQQTGSQPIKLMDAEAICKALDVYNHPLPLIDAMKRIRAKRGYG